MVVPDLSEINYEGGMSPGDLVVTWTNEMGFLISVILAPEDPNKVKRDYYVLTRGKVLKLASGLSAIRRVRIASEIDYETR